MQKSTSLAQLSRWRILVVADMAETKIHESGNSKLAISWTHKAMNSCDRCILFHFITEPALTKSTNTLHSLIKGNKVGAGHVQHHHSLHSF